MDISQYGAHSLPLVFQPSSMTLRLKIYISASIAGVIAIGFVAGTAWSSYRLSKLETAVDIGTQRADTVAAAAEEAERRASQYISHIEYLERQLSDIHQLAQKQDEELQKLTIDTRTARGRVDAARRVRTVAATADELCQKLADLGHPC